MTPDDDDEPKFYEVYRMLPPGQHKYFYSVGTTLQVARDQPQGDGAEKNLVKPQYLDMKRSLLPSEIGKGSTRNSANSDKKKSPKGTNRNTNRKAKGTQR